MEVRQGRKWYRVLKRFGDKILVEKLRLIGKDTQEWENIGDYEEVK